MLLNSEWVNNENKGDIKRYYRPISRDKKKLK